MMMTRLHDRDLNRGRCPKRLVLLFVGFTLALAAATACDDAGPGLSAELRLTVVSPNGEEGSALIELVGAVEDIESTARGWLLTSSAADTTWVLVAAEQPDTLSVLVRLRSDGQLRSSRLLDVAGPNDGQRQDLTDYRLEVR